MKQYEDLFKVNEELAELVADTFGTRDFQPKTYARTIIIFFVAKAYRTLRAISYLCSRGYGEDAGILLRSLFEIVVNALYIEDNEELAQRYADFEAIYVYRLSVDPALKGVYKSLSEDKVREIGEDYKRAQDKHKYKDKRNWSGKPIKKMAEKVGLGEAYAYLYVLMSQLTHSTVDSSRYYLQEDKVRSVVRVKLSPSYNLIPEDLLTAGALMLYIVRQWSNQFNLGIETKIQEIDIRLQELKEKYVQSGPQQGKLP